MDILGILSEQDVLCVTMRRSGMTYKQIAHELGVSQERVRQRILKVARRLGHPANAGGGGGIAHLWIDPRPHGKPSRDYFPKYSSAASYEQVKALLKWEQSARDVEAACREMGQRGVRHLTDDLNEAKIVNEWRRNNGTGFTGVVKSSLRFTWRQSNQ